MMKEMNDKERDRGTLEEKGDKMKSRQINLMPYKERKIKRKPRRKVLMERQISDKECNRETWEGKEDKMKTRESEK